VAIPHSVINIGKFAFSFCPILFSVTIPNSVTSIGDWAFRACLGLTNITVDSANQNYSSIDGVLFDKGQRTLIEYPPGKAGASYSIPNSVTSLRDFSFENCLLTTVTIPNCNIGDSAFGKHRKVAGGSISLEIYADQAGVVECIVSNVRDAVGNRDVGQAGAEGELPVPDAGYSVPEDDIGQACAVIPTDQSPSGGL
jgi:hypothetical protein